MLPVRRALRRAVAVANRPTPVARPARPSMRLKALAQPTNQRMVRGICHQMPMREWPPMPWIWTPALHAKTAARIWPASSICIGAADQPEDGEGDLPPDAYEGMAPDAVDLDSGVACQDGG